MNGSPSIKKIEMSFQTFLTPANLLQTLVLALSIFDTVSFIWLALTVWLNGDRQTAIARLGVVGLGFSALFFFIHALLISSLLSPTKASLIPLDFWWRLIWLPAISVPYIWFAIGLHYAALINKGWQRRRPLLLICSGLFGSFLLLLLILNRTTFTFIGTLRLLAYSDLFNDTHASLFSPSVFLPVLFLFYVTFCAIGPWFTLGRINRLWKTFWRTLAQKTRTTTRASTSSVRLALTNAFWDDPTDFEQLEEPVLSWHMARPILFLAAILMVLLTTTLGIIGIWSIADWFELRPHTSISLPSSLTMNAIPLNLLTLDLLATGSVAIIILLVGYSIVRHGILIERPLARRGFFEQWRGIVIVSTAVAVFISLLVDFTQSSLGGLLLITSLATCVYSLFTWSSYTAHDRYIALLAPFLRGTNLRHWLNTDQKKTEQGLEDLFFLLCKDVLAVKWARLTVIAGSVRRSFDYRWPVTAQEQIMHTVPRMIAENSQSITKRPPARIRITLDGKPTICWILPIYDELGLVATLYLGPRQDGAAFTDEDMDLAHACGERILDALGDHEAMQAVAALLRRRIVDVKLLGAQHRRILHDDILPQMHLALLQLETLRSTIHANQVPSPSVSQAQEEASTPERILNEAVDMISGAHRRLAAMMRSTTPSAPHRLERDGLMHAIHSMIEQDFQHAFDEVQWEVSAETAANIDEITPPAIAELIFAAVQEALRNAARHARGSNVHRRLCLTLKATCNLTDPHLEVIVADDGVGIISASTSTTGTGGGLLTHSALLAIAGGNLTLKSNPDEGVTVRIYLPTESLR